MTENKKYIVNISWLMFERILRVAVVFFITVYIVRFLGPEKFGILSYVLSFSGLFLAFAGLGLDTVVVRNLVRHPDSANDLLGTAFCLKLSGGLIAIILAVAASISISNSHYLTALIALTATMFLFKAVDVIDLYFQSQVKSVYVAQALLAQLLIMAMVKLLLIYLAAELWWFVVAFLLDTVLLSSFLLLNYFRVVGPINWSWDMRKAKELMADSWPLMFSGLVISIYMKVDQVMIKDMLGLQEVGYYAAAVKLSEGFYFIPAIIASSLFPMIVKEKNNKESSALRSVQLLYDIMFYISLPLALTVFMQARYVVEIIFGLEYSAAAEVLAIHMWALIFVSLGVARGKWIVSENLQLYSAGFLLVGLAINIALNLVLIPRFGIVGAAYALLFAQIFGTYVAPIFFRKTRISFFMMTRSLFCLNMFAFLFRARKLF
jgi:O-antigen/teichoic acid export membrane protein